LTPFKRAFCLRLLFWAYFLLTIKESDFIDAKMPHSILIVEDEKIVREGLARALSHSYKTFQAANGRAAIEIIDRNNDIVVVVSDLKMPEVNGFELLEKIRTDNKEVDVIFVTAFFSIESAVDAMRRGAFDYMTKPVDIRKLEATIQKAIERKKI
jgi:DNA-binding NtrC family response regulator